MRKFLLLIYLLFVVVLIVQAQGRTITGRVTSADDGSALPGVNVVVKGSTTGTVTDSNGQYTLLVPSAGGTLVFSFIGLKTLETEIGSRAVVDVSLTADVTQLSEVVGSSSAIFIRGFTTFTGCNQPLFVIDGIPIDNGSMPMATQTGVSTSNRAIDLNQDDIESMTVLSRSTIRIARSRSSDQRSQQTNYIG